MKTRKDKKNTKKGTLPYQTHIVQTPDTKTLPGKISSVFIFLTTDDCSQNEQDYSRVFSKVKFKRQVLEKASVKIPTLGFDVWNSTSKFATSI